MLTLAGALSKGVTAVLAENVPVLFKEILCFVKEILDLLQQLEGRLAEISDTGLEKERGAPLGEEGTGLCLQVACQMSLAFLTPVFFFSFASSLPSPLVCCTMHPEAARYAIYSRIHLAHLCVPGIW